MAIRHYIGGRLSFRSTDTLPTGYLDGTIATEIDTGKTYVLTGNIWSESNPTWVEKYTIPNAGAAAGILIGIPNSRYYKTGYYELDVYVDGFRQSRDTSLASNDYDYKETNTTGVSFNYALPSGSTILFQINR